jgi:epoxyqueuosine reductase
MSYYGVGEEGRDKSEGLKKRDETENSSPFSLISSPSQRKGRIARYAWRRDYHGVIRKRLHALVRYIEALAPGTRCKIFVDTGPLLERAVAQRAGLGFVGKNTLLITRGLGSWVFLASVITTLDLPTDEPDQRTCGTCTLCIDACPTRAITAPYDLDARRCIAYLTIETKDSTPVELRGKTGEWLFGCDICQDVCPHNTRVEKPLEFFNGGGIGPELDPAEVLSIRTDEEFAARFSGTPLARPGRHGLLRNACLVAANRQRTDLLPQLTDLARHDPHPVVRDHAHWAAQQLTQKQTVDN